MLCKGRERDPKALETTAQGLAHCNIGRMDRTQKKEMHGLVHASLPLFRLAMYSCCPLELSVCRQYLDRQTRMHHAKKIPSGLSTQTVGQQEEEIRLGRLDKDGNNGMFQNVRYVQRRCKNWYDHHVHQ